MVKVFPQSLVAVHVTQVKPTPPIAAVPVLHRGVGSPLQIAVGNPGEMKKIKQNHLAIYN